MTSHSLFVFKKTRVSCSSYLASGLTTHRKQKILGIVRARNWMRLRITSRSRMGPFIEREFFFLIPVAEDGVIFAHSR